jgi:DNA-binding beta-propeller fold protein YncE
LVGTVGSSSNLFNTPRSVAVDPNINTFYITDSNNDRVMGYTLNSTVGTLVAGGNGAGINSNQLNNPRGLYFDSITNSLFITNCGTNNIVQWVIGASNWTLIAGDINGASGNESSLLNCPYDVILDRMRNIYVADRYNNRIQFFLAGQTNGTTIAGVNCTAGSNMTMLFQPLTVALDSQLNLYVADTNNNRVQKFVRY